MVSTGEDGEGQVAFSDGGLPPGSSGRRGHDLPHGGAQEAEAKGSGSWNGGEGAGPENRSSVFWMS